MTLYLSVPLLAFGGWWFLRLLIPLNFHSRRRMLMSGYRTPPELIDIAGKIYGETERAYRFHDGSKLVWLSKSQVEWDDEARVMVMPVWLAKERELL